MRKLITALAILGGVALGTITASPASAAAASCGTVPAVTVVKTDGGHPSPWAQDVISRSMTICQDGDATHYVTTGHDSGTFVTTGPASPAHGKPLAAGIKGSIVGVFTGHLVTSSPLDLGALATPAASTTTGTWAKTAVGSAYVSGSDTETYVWTYTVDGDCGQRWIDASNNNDGQDASAGDITAKCAPKPTPTVTATHKVPVPGPTKTKTTTRTVTVPGPAVTKTTTAAPAPTVTETATVPGPETTTTVMAEPVADNGGGSSFWLWLGFALIIVGAIVAALVVRSNRRRR